MFSVLSPAHRRLLASVLTLLLPAALFGHHPGAGGGASPLGPRPFTRLGYGSELRQGEQGDRDRWLHTIAGEYDWQERFSIYGAASYHYLSQNSRSDAGRYGRPEFGAKALLLDWSGFFLSVQGAYLPATGPTRSVFVDEDFHEGRAAANLEYEGDRWFAELGLSGAFPLSRLPVQAPPAPADPVKAASYEPPASQQSHELKKTTDWRVRGGFFLNDSWFASAGFSYRLPYAGILKERDTRGHAPGVYRSVDLGLGYKTKDGWLMQLGYEHPFYQRRERPDFEPLVLLAFTGRAPENTRRQRLYAGAWRFSIAFAFGEARSEDEWLEGDREASPQPEAPAESPPTTE